MRKGPAIHVSSSLLATDVSTETGAVSVTQCTPKKKVPARAKLGVTGQEASVLGLGRVLYGFVNEG